MTWDEFKKFVDEKVKAEGCDGSVPLGYIKFVSSGRSTIEVGVLNKDRGVEATLNIFND